MQLIFRGDPNELAQGRGLSRTSIDAYGVHFVMGEPVDVSGLTDVQKRKLSTNPHFEVVAGDVVVAEAAMTPLPAEAESDDDAEEASATAAHAARAANKRKK